MDDNGCGDGSAGRGGHWVDLPILVSAETSMLESIKEATAYSAIIVQHRRLNEVCLCVTPRGLSGWIALWLFGLRFVV